MIIQDYTQLIRHDRPFHAYRTYFTDENHFFANVKGGD